MDAISSRFPQMRPLAEAAKKAGEGKDEAYVLAQFGHAALQEHAPGPVLDAVMDQLVLTGPTAAAVVQVARPFRDLHDLAFYQVLRARHRPPEEALVGLGMRATMTTPDWREKAKVANAVLQGVQQHTHDALIAKIAGDARQRCFDMGLARGREADASILIEAFPKILDRTRTLEDQRLAAIKSATLPERPMSHIEEGDGFVDLGSLRIPL